MCEARWYRRQGTVHSVTRLPPLDPAVTRTRLAVRRALSAAGGPQSKLLFVALSGGADSLALAAAAAFEAPRLGWRAGAIIIDHGLQAGSHDVAGAAAEQAATLGLDPVITRRVYVPAGSSAGPEAAARDARYAAFDAVLAETDAEWVLTAHTLDDQAEQVLLGIARGSGTRSIAGIPPIRGHMLRPFLLPDAALEHAVDRATTEAACRAQGLNFWRDPHNIDAVFARVRVRQEVLPVMEDALGPGIARSLARTAEIAREDADALDAIAREHLGEIMEPSEQGTSVPVAALRELPPALRGRIIRAIGEAEFGSTLTREHTLRIAGLVTDWRGQGPIDVPGITVRRTGARLVFETRQTGPAPRVQ